MADHHRLDDHVVRRRRAVELIPDPVESVSHFSRRGPRSSLQRAPHPARFQIRWCTSPDLMRGSSEDREDQSLLSMDRISGMCHHRGLAATNLATPVQYAGALVCGKTKSKLIIILLINR